MNSRTCLISPAGLIKHVREVNYNAGAAGLFEISDLPKGHIYNQVFFGEDTARNFTSLLVERDNFIVFERTKAENEVVQADGVRTVQANYLVYDPTENGNGTEGLATRAVQDLRFKLQVTNAGAIPVTVVSIGPLER